MKRRAFVALIFPSSVVLSNSARVPDTSLYEGVLNKHVRSDGKVDYAGIKAHIGPLADFVRQMATVSPDSNPELFPSPAAKLAYWINAYNAFVLHAFASEYPLKRERLKGTLGKFSFFYRAKHPVGGVGRSLADIENKTIRRFGEPRIHFAIVCASASCPALSRLPYAAANIEQHLESGTRRYLGERRNFALDSQKREVTLPRIFEWFKEDFGGRDERLLAFAAKYRPLEAPQLKSGTWKIRYFDYDWSPNDVVT